MGVSFCNICNTLHTQGKKPNPNQRAIIIYHDEAILRQYEAKMNPRLSAKYNAKMSTTDVIRSNCRVISLFGLWFALNVCYNITNKWALEDVREKVNEAAAQQNDFEVSYLSSSLPLTIGCIQFGVGSAYACFLWLLRIRPLPHADQLLRIMTVIKRNCIGLVRMIRSAQFAESFRIAIVSSREHSNNPSPVTLRDTSKIAVYHTFGQLCTIMSLSTNSISFAHVIKAMEPLFSAVASWLVLGQVMNIRVYMSLLPVVFGVAMACAGAKEFSWISFWSGMGSNAFFAMRGVVSKTVMEKSASERPLDANDTDIDQREREHLHASHTQISPANLFAAVTCASFLLSIPLALITEGSILIMLVNNSAEKEGQDVSRTLSYIISSGAFHYLNNEVMYVTLSKVHPITLAVGNTAKRVFIIVAGIIVFSTPVTVETAVGATIGIGGVFVYSLMKQWYDNSDKNNANQATERDEQVPTTELTHTHIT